MKSVKCPVTSPVVGQRVDGGMAVLFHDHGTRSGWVVSITPRPHFTPRKRPGTHCTRGWAPGPGWTGRKSCPTRVWSPDSPPLNQSLYQLSYPAHEIIHKVHEKFCSFVEVLCDQNCDWTKHILLCRWIVVTVYYVSWSFVARKPQMNFWKFWHPGVACEVRQMEMTIAHNSTLDKIKVSIILNSLLVKIFFFFFCIF